MSKRNLIGLRTVKTAVAVILSMMVASLLGTSDARLIFAMLGAMNAVQPTFKESVQASLTQIIGVVFGVGVSVLLLALPIHRLVVTGIGIVLIITLYNALHITFSPGVPCLLLVILCTTDGIAPISYGLGRVWDTALGVAVGMVINMLVFPYDNSRRIRATVESLDREVIAFLEDLFDGDDVMPNSERMTKKIDELEAQLQIFEKQKLFLRLRTQHREIEQFHLYESKARMLLAQMEVLCHMGQPGHLTEENRQQLLAAGAQIADGETLQNPQEWDFVRNYHVSQILTIREQLLEILQ